MLVFDVARDFVASNAMSNIKRPHAWKLDCSSCRLLTSVRSLFLATYACCNSWISYNCLHLMYCIRDIRYIDYIHIMMADEVVVVVVVVD